MPATMRRQNKEGPMCKQKEERNALNGVRSMTELMSADAGRLVCLAEGRPRFGGFYFLSEISHRVIQLRVRSGRC